MHRADEHFLGNGRVTAARARHIPVIGVGGPVGSGKTALVEALCLRLRDHISLAVVTNDIPDHAVAVGVPCRVIKYRDAVQVDR